MNSNTMRLSRRLGAAFGIVVMLSLASSALALCKLRSKQLAFADCVDQIIITSEQTAIFARSRWKHRERYALEIAGLGAAQPLRQQANR